MDTIVVTGGAGFIGGTFVRLIIEQGEYQVVNLDKLTYAGNLDSLKSILEHPHHHFVQADIADREVVAKLLDEHQPVGVFHFAAESHVDRSIDSPLAFLETNILGTFHLLEACLQYWGRLSDSAKDAFRFVQVSTDEVYGSLGPEGKFTETTAYSPNSPYSASKASADHFARAFHHTYGLPVLTTNCSNNYGPFQFPEKLIPLMILNCLHRKPLPIYGNGQQVRDWLYVEDHCDAIWKVFQQGRVGEVYNIGGDCERSNLEVVQTICAEMDKRLQPDTSCQELITYVKDRPGHDLRYAIDISKIQSELDWAPKMDFATGIGNTIDWYLNQAEWLERIASGGYQQQRLGIRIDFHIDH